MKTKTLKENISAFLVASGESGLEGNEKRTK